ncbi:MAG: hypothetical protein Unbinned96contig1001_3 [Prokaryotic dsDNA virus sp.]|nr:MAG: hypothetical protein Unbinned96contig1001_3 [Prokaryotic dsDNA virus sp.]|tara:strand:- start:1164 stop:1502 length:339 start_codon:yes stop_codon:yes gene_type:complete
MNNQEILKNAPEGATHVDDENGYWILSANQNIKDQCYMDNKGFRDLSTFGFAFRDLSDLRRIVELESQNAELLEVVNAVAHIGVDFGFGPYELQPEDIEKARTLLAKGESND